MKEFDSVGLFLCKMQGSLFVASKELSTGSAVFIRRFMFSDVAKRMDGEFILYSSDTQNSLLEEIENQYQNKPYGSKKYSDEELYWIGYLYRYWCYRFDRSSKYVYKIIGATELRNLYFPYHSLDPLQAIERINEAKNRTDEDAISEGVKIFRKIWWSRHKKEE